MMSTSKRWPVICGAFALVLLVAGVAGAQPRPPRHGRQGGMGGPDMEGKGRMGMKIPGPEVEMIDEMADELGLTPKQRQQVRDLVDDTRRKQIRLRADLKTIEIDLRRELEKEDPDLAKVDAMLEQTGKLEVELRKNRLHAWVGIRKVLNKDQRKKLDTLREERREDRREERRAGRRGGPPGELPPPASSGAPTPPRKPVAPK